MPHIQTVAYTAASPKALELGDGRHHGTVYEYTFKTPQNLFEVQFQNYYCSIVSLCIKKAVNSHAESGQGQDIESGTNDSESVEWIPAFNEIVVMEEAHYDQGSCKTVRLNKIRSSTNLNGISGVRLVLYQTGTWWKKKDISGVRFYVYCDKSEEAQEGEAEAFEKLKHNTYLIHSGSLVDPPMDLESASDRTS